MRALWLPDVLRDAGLTVVTNAGWETRGKELDAIEGVCAHHTASPPTSTLATNLSVVINGNSVAPGPIAQLLLWRDGTFHVIASGRANHAGAGGPLPWLPASVDGVVSPANKRTLGIEAVNNGVGEQWAPQMVDAYERGVAAILRHIGQDESRAFTHHEWAPTRKIDPAGPTGGRVATIPGRLTWDPNAWRALIRQRLAPTPTPIPQPPSGDDTAMKAFHVRVPGHPEKGEALVLIHMVGFTTPAQVATARQLFPDLELLDRTVDEFDVLADTATS